MNDRLTYSPITAYLTQSQPSSPIMQQQYQIFQQQQQQQQHATSAIVSHHLHAIGSKPNNLITVTTTANNLPFYQTYSNYQQIAQTNEAYNNNPVRKVNPLIGTNCNTVAAYHHYQTPNHNPCTTTATAYLANTVNTTSSKYYMPIVSTANNTYIAVPSFQSKSESWSPSSQCYRI